MIAKFFPMLLVTGAIAVSCSDTKKEEESTQVYNKPVVDSIAVNKPLPDSVIIKSLLQPAASTKSLPGVSDAPAPVQSTSLVIPGVSAARLNPAHGQPGHRCDIAVGVPLDSKPLPANTVPVQVPIAATQATPAITAQSIVQKVAPGMNPAHGQPNHRCDIAVGAPLNSKPVTTAVSNSKSPVAVSVTPPPVKVAPGMNPSHGQPGHRCDIAVGAPLNSRPIAPAPAVVPVNPAPAKTDSSKK